jgi:hypothetical protein
MASRGASPGPGGGGIAAGDLGVALVTGRFFSCDNPSGIINLRANAVLRSISDKRLPKIANLRELSLLKRADQIIPDDPPGGRIKPGRY